MQGNICALNTKDRNMSTKGTKWVFEPTHCKIGFSVTHFTISEVEGFFRTFTGTVESASADFSDARVTLSIPVKSIDTQEPGRDQHLLNSDFFEADRYPEITFKSTGLRPLGERLFLMTGDLTMKNVTNPVELEVRFQGIIPKDPFGNTKAGFKVTGSVNRKDWGITWNVPLDMGGLAVGEQIAITAHIQLVQVKEVAAGQV